MNPGYFFTALTVIGAGTFFLWLGSGDSIRSDAGPESMAEGAPRVRAGGHSGSTRHGWDSWRESARTVQPGSDGNPKGRIQPEEADAAERRPGTSRGRMHRLPVKAYLPLAFAELPGEVEQDDRYVGDLIEVQDRFILALGGEDTDPSTPEYKEKWLNAQRQADLELRARIGAQAFAARQRAARQQQTGAVQEEP